MTALVEIRLLCLLLAGFALPGLAACDETGFVAGVLTPSQYLNRAFLEEPAWSPYCLPYPEGEAYPIHQSCCLTGWSHAGRFAYDFLMPYGAEIVAARGGIVVEVRDHYPDSERRGGYENLVAIQHDDGTVALYIHLKYLGSLVTLGELVSIGQPIGLAGATGDSDAVNHLHFEVFERPPARHDVTVPIGFRNAEGPLDERGGLIANETYFALPCG